MPTYRYKCPTCEHQFDIYKGFSEIDNLEKCPSCGRGLIEGKNRVIGVAQFFGEKPDDPFYSIPLGKMVSSKKEMRSIAKSKGWEEMGSSNIEKHIESSDRDRERKAQEKWDEFSKPIELNG
jgi:putative FmdB family regulatory protein